MKNLLKAETSDRHSSITELPIWPFLIRHLCFIRRRRNHPNKEIPTIECQYEFCHSYLAKQKWPGRTVREPILRYLSQVEIEKLYRSALQILHGIGITKILQANFFIRKEVFK